MVLILCIIFSGSDTRICNSISAGTSNWVSFATGEEIWGHQFKLNIGKLQPTLILEGFHTQETEQWNWLWDQGVTLLLNTTDNPDEEPLAINFDYDTLDAGLGLQIQVIADDGVTVMAVVNR